MSLETIQIEERRLAVLKVLEKAPGKSLNAYVMHRSLGAIGHACTLDQVKSSAFWLKEQDLIGLEDMGGGMMVLTLKQHGSEAQRGLCHIPGVASPYPAD